MNGDSDCDSTKTSKVTSGLNQNGGHVIVNPRSENLHVIDNNVKRTTFIYSSKVNATCIETLMVRQSLRGPAVKVNKNVVDGYVIRASGMLCVSVIHAFFQHLSNAIRNIMSQKDCTMIDLLMIMVAWPPYLQQQKVGFPPVFLLDIKITLLVVSYTGAYAFV